MSDASTINSTLDDAHVDADRVLHAARYRAGVLSLLAAETDRGLVEARIGRLLALRRTVAGSHDRIQLAYVAMIEATARVTERLAAVAREATFESPEWPDGIRAALEVKLSQTREVTVRVAAEPRGASTWRAYSEGG